MAKSSQASNNTKSIKVFIKNGDDTKVKVLISKKPFTPAEFTSVWMAVLDTYTQGLLETNTKEQIFEHFNSVFGIYLERLVPTKEHYELDKAHKDLKKIADETLGRKETAEDKKATEDNRLAAYLLCRDILVKDVGMTEDTADILLNKRLGLSEGLNDPKGLKNEKE